MESRVRSILNVWLNNNDIQLPTSDVLRLKELLLEMYVSPELVYNYHFDVHRITMTVDFEWLKGLYLFTHIYLKTKIMCRDYPISKSPIIRQVLIQRADDFGFTFIINELMSLD